MYRMLTILLPILIFLSGCAAGQLVGKIPIVENDNYASVHIARPSGYAGCGVRMTIQIDYKDFYELACGDYITFRVPADKPIILSQTTSISPDNITIVPVKGREYYLENDCNGWACWLSESTKSNFLNIMEGKTRETTKIGF